MKKRSLISRGGRGLNSRLSLLTGEHCPESGWWASEAEPQTARFISEGSVMPAHRGVAVSWKQATPLAPSLRATELPLGAIPSG